jgi:hypothetical protein
MSTTVRVVGEHVYLVKALISSTSKNNPSVANEQVVQLRDAYRTVPV